jgi:hypothetical protein
MNVAGKSGYRVVSCYGAGLPYSPRRVQGSVVLSWGNQTLLDLHDDGARPMALPGYAELGAPT